MSLWPRGVMNILPVCVREKEGDLHDNKTVIEVTAFTGGYLDDNSDHNDDDDDYDGGAR